jgi:hypothetical protein
LKVFLPFSSAVMLSMAALPPVPSRVPNKPAFKGLNRPSRVECDVAELEVDGEEGDGYLLAVASYFPEALGRLLVFDTRSLTSGPVTVVKASLFLRPTFHGMWLPAADRVEGRARHQFPRGHS